MLWCVENHIVLEYLDAGDLYRLFCTHKVEEYNFLKHVRYQTDRGLLTYTGTPAQSSLDSSIHHVKNFLINARRVNSLVIPLKTELEYNMRLLLLLSTWIYGTRICNFCKRSVSNAPDVIIRNSWRYATIVYHPKFNSVGGEYLRGYRTRVDMFVLSYMSKNDIEHRTELPYSSISVCKNCLERRRYCSVHSYCKKHGIRPSHFYRFHMIEKGMDAAFETQKGVIYLPLHVLKKTHSDMHLVYKSAFYEHVFL